MVDVLGHVAMALLLTTPAWFPWHRRFSVAFVGCALFTAMVPDVDLYLQGVPHHGPTHTVLFVGLVALGGGVLVTVAALPVLRRWERRSESGHRSGPGPSSRWGVYGFVVTGLFVGGSSHLFIDMLSAGTGGNPPLEPFWPVFTAPVSIDFIYYSSFRWNGGLLVLALVVHVVLFARESTRSTASTA